MVELTVGIPCYADNSQSLDFLKQCLESVSSQANENVQILIVDDGSPLHDEVENIAKVLGAEYHYIPKNNGIGWCRNEIIRRCNTRKLFFLSADDLLMPGAVDVLLKHGTKDGEFYFFNFNIHDGINTFQSNIPQFASEEDFVFSVIREAKRGLMFLNYNCLGTVTTWKDNLFWEDKRYGEDLYHLLECLLIKKVKFTHVPNTVMIVRMHENSWTSRLGLNEKIASNNKDTFKRINEKLGAEIL